MGLALEYAVQILNGLEVAHNRGIVHRDLKPDNVFIVPMPQGPLLKLLDFGIAKLRNISENRGMTRPGALMGTPEYMAPEQAFGAETADHRADLYALGVILFEALAGFRPLPTDNPHEMAAMAMRGQTPRLVDTVPGIPLGVSDAVSRALAGPVESRFHSAAEMRGSLLPFCTIASHTAGGPSTTGTAPVSPPIQPLMGHAPLPSQVGAPVPTQPDTNPDEPSNVPATIPPGGLPGSPMRTGTVLGGAAMPNLAPECGGLASTADMAPYPQPIPIQIPPPTTHKKKKSGSGTTIAVLFLLFLVGVAVFLFFSRSYIAEHFGADRNKRASAPLGLTYSPDAAITTTPFAPDVPDSSFPALPTTTQTVYVLPPATTTPTTPSVTKTATTSPPPAQDAGADARRRGPLGNMLRDAGVLPPPGGTLFPIPWTPPRSQQQSP